MHSTRFRWSVVASLAATLLFAAACGGEGAPPEDATTTDGGAGTTTAGGTEGVDTLVLGASGFSFSPATLTVEQGATLTLSNPSGVGHTFTVADQGIDVVLDGGAEEQITIELPPGTYPFVCTFHERSGMRGSLTVEA